MLRRPKDSGLKLIATNTLILSSMGSATGIF